MRTFSKSDLIDKQIDAFNEQNKTQVYETSFSFLREHKGFRPECLHVLIGTPGGGKSTLVRSLVQDYVKSNPLFNVAIWLSEEKEIPYRALMKPKDKSFSTQMNDSVFIISELELPDHCKMSENDQLRYVIETIKENKPDLLIFDNLTTSTFYEGKKPGLQSLFIKNYKEVIQKMGIPSFLIAHTSSGVINSRRALIDANEIRGSKQISNLTEYFYILQGFTIEGKPIKTLRTVKHRYHHEVEEKLFILLFDRMTGTYSKSMPINFERLKDFFKQDERL